MYARQRLRLGLARSVAQSCQWRDSRYRASPVVRVSRHSDRRQCSVDPVNLVVGQTSPADLDYGTREPDPYLSPAREDDEKAPIGS